MADQDLDQLRQDAADQRQAIARDLEYVGDRVSPGRIAERQRAVVVSRVNRVRSSVFGTSDRQRSSLPGGGGDDDASLRDQAGSAVDKLKEKSPDGMADFTEGNPLAAGVVGFGIGLLVATLIPETREEQRIAHRAQDHLDSAAEELGRSGREAAENVKPAAQEAAQQVKDSAQDSAQNVQSHAKSAADDVRSTAEDQRDQLQSGS